MKTKMHYSRRSINILLISVFLLLQISCGEKSKRDAANETLWYRQPAKEWNQALPLGNGRMGAMVFGGSKVEKIQLNEESLWAGEQFQSAPDDFYPNLQKVQQLVLEGNQVEADRVGTELLTKKPTSFRSFEPLGDISIEMKHRYATIEDYRRELDLRDGIIRVSYKVYGVQYRREYLISAEDDVLAVHMTASEPGAISGNVAMSRWEDAEISPSGNNQLRMDGQIMDPENPTNDPNPGGSGPGGAHMKFAGRLLVQNTEGSVSATDGVIVLDQADEATILFTAATDYNLDKMNFDRTIDPAARAEDILSKATKKSWEEIRKAHIREHRSLFERVSLDLGRSERDTLPTNERLDSVKAGGLDPGLLALYFQYGRYMLMSSSRAPGKLPTNLQGIWSNRKWAPWEADYHLNINLEMNYWPADPTNLSNTVDPLAGWLKELSKNGSITAQRLYEADGWVAYVASNPFGRTTPSASTLSSQFNNGVLDPLPGAWIAMTLWRHYEYNQDEAYLKEVYPVLKGAAEFVAGILVEDENGKMVVVPSTSPENQYIEPESGKTIRITKASTYHMTLARVIFDAVIDASSVLETDQELRNRLKDMKAQFPPFKIGEDGTIQEWIEDYEEANPGHRHMSHLLGLHPFSLISPQQPELYAAAKKTVEQRLQHGGGWTGWSRAHSINLYARLLDGEAVYNNLYALLRKSTMFNLFDTHPPFQIDGNFGGTAGIAEMLLQSHLQDENGNYIVHLLPALPSAWQDGEVQGLRARGGFEVDISWENGKLTSAKVHSSQKGVLKLKYKDKMERYEVKPGQSTSFNLN